MPSVIVCMHDRLFGDSVKATLALTGNYQVTEVRKPEEAQTRCCDGEADILLMDVTRYPPFTLEETLKLRSVIKKSRPQCKIVLCVDENSEKDVAEKVMTAKRDGLIDQFIFGSTSGDYLVALVDTL